MGSQVSRHSSSSPPRRCFPLVRSPSIVKAGNLTKGLQRHPEDRGKAAELEPREHRGLQPQLGQDFSTTLTADSSLASDRISAPHSPRTAAGAKLVLSEMDELFLYGSFSLPENVSAPDQKMTLTKAATNNYNSKQNQTVEPPPYNRQIRIIAMTIIFTVGLVGNSLVIYKICRQGKDKKRKIDFLITHLALADLYVSVITLFSQIVWELLEDEWVAGDVACRIFKVFQVSGLIASSNIIAIVALERHHVIMNPLSAPLPSRRFAAMGWLLALLLSVPQAFVFKASNTKDGDRCLSVFGQLPRWHFQAYIIYSSVTVFFLPFCVLVVAYSRILWVIWRRGKIADSPERYPDVCGLQVTKRPLKLVATNSCIPRAKVKTLKMTLVIIILFIVCGLPYFIVEMKVAFGIITGLDEEVMAVLGIFVVTNSAVNPYVYLFFKSSNVFLSRLEKKVCFSCCLRENREVSFRREMFPSAAPTPRRDPSTSTTSEVEASSGPPRSATYVQPMPAIDRERGTPCENVM
ncbi:probable G-protein coupled receptor 150 [Hyperolius riggenbachi]|uniref:probable G-protein coupled receptor 150 n=1 Tax=Hyperolius riggenbachi TaxID=752182 RepID=UPI0035A38F93